MSLVYEALQKAEREKQRKAGIIPPPQPVPVREAKPVVVEKPLPQQQPAPTVTSPSRSYQPVLVGLMMCVCVAALVAIVYLVAGVTKPSASPVPTNTTTAVSTTSVPTSVTTESPATPPPLNPVDARFRITGIMRGPEGKFCAVLNGKIVYEDYYVDGATVKRITQDRVTLDVGGRETVVRLY